MNLIDSSAICVQTTASWSAQRDSDDKVFIAKENPLKGKKWRSSPSEKKQNEETQIPRGLEVCCSFDLPGSYDYLSAFGGQEIYGRVRQAAVTSSFYYWHRQ